MTSTGAIYAFTTEKGLKRLTYNNHFYIGVPKMMSKTPRWQDTLVNSKVNKPVHKKMGKESKPSISFGKQSSSRTKSILSVVRSNSLSSRDLSSATKVGGGLKHSSINEQGYVGPQDTRSASRLSRPARRLYSSQSFSSLHGSSFSVAPFIRSSRSLSRLDQGVKDEKKDLDSRKLSPSLVSDSDCKDSSLNSSEDMKTSFSCQSSESSCSVATCHHHSNKVKKQTRDGVYTLCAITSGLRRNWVQAILRNVRPSATPAITIPMTEQSPKQQLDSQFPDTLRKDEVNGTHKEENNDKQHQNSVEHLRDQQREQEQPNTDQTSSHKGPVSALTTPMSPSTNPQTSDLLVQNAETELLNDSYLNDDEDLHFSKSAKQVEECKDTSASAEQTGQLVKELEKTQKELSRLQQINKVLQDELQHEKQRHLKETGGQQSELLSNPASSLEQVGLQQLQKINQDLRSELEEQRRSQDEAREAELRRRVDLLAQQAQLLVTGDATTLAQAQLEQDRQQFLEKQFELEQCISSLKSQLCSSEEKRAEVESHLTQVQLELQGLCNLQQEANQLKENYQDVTSQLRAYEEVQAQKEARLEKHLMLLQASQERERRSLAASLAQAEKRSHDFQEQLGRAEEQVENLNKNYAWTREIQEAHQQLQKELHQTVTTMQQLQEERDQLDLQCQELQSQVSELGGEVSRLQGRLKTDETHFYNLEHSYEKVCEELQVALGKVRQWETETEDMREGYERQLDQKEQELTEVLLKMEVLGNSLEETEMKMSEMLKEKEVSSDKTQLLTNTHDVNVENYTRSRSRSIDPSYQSIVTDGDDPERFMSIIQFLENKLYITEEKLRDITQRLEDYQDHVSCQDPHLCSQLTQTRAKAQHLGLLLHTQAKHNQRFAQAMENRCRMLVGRFQVALNIVQACRGRLQEAGSHIDVVDFEKQLATLVNCLQQGEKDAEKQQHESRQASKEEERILKDRTITDDINVFEHGSESVGKYLSREIFVVETMTAILQSKNVRSQLQVMHKENEGNLLQTYKSMLSQKMAFKAQSRNDESVESVLSSACVEAELIYTALKFQQQNVNLGMKEVQTFELVSYEEHEETEGKSVQRETKVNDKKQYNKTSDAENQTDWVEELISTLQKRAQFLHQLCQDISEVNTHESTWDNGAKWMHEEAKVIYLTHRLFLDLEKEQNETKLEAPCKDQEVTLQQGLNKTLSQLEEDNSMLREELEQAEQRVIVVETGNQKLLEDIQKIESYHNERMQKLEMEFQEKIKELQRIHEEEMKHLHDYYSKSCFSKEKLSKTSERSTLNQSDGTRVHGAQSNLEEMEKSERFSAMEEMHKKLIGDLQRQHQKEVAKLLKEKDQLLKEETAATMAAIVAMRRAHKEELEKTRRSQNIRENTDVSQLHLEYEKELQSLHKDLELLSVQHTEKCLENSQLNQELQQERKSLIRFQKENQELKKKQRETDEVSPLHSPVIGKHVMSDDKDLYETEVILRAREAEMQFLRQEALSLKEELKLARMNTIYAQNKLKSLCAGTPDEKFYKDFKCATWSPQKQEQSEMFSEEAVTNKTGKCSLSRQLKAVRSKSLKEGLSVQEWMKLFES